MGFVYMNRLASDLLWLLSAGFNACRLSCLSHCCDECSLSPCFQAKTLHFTSWCMALSFQPCVWLPMGQPLALESIQQGNILVMKVSCPAWHTPHPHTPATTKAVLAVLWWLPALLKCCSSTRATLLGMGDTGWDPQAAPVPCQHSMHQTGQHRHLLLAPGCEKSLSVLAEQRFASYWYLLQAHGLRHAKVREDK